MNVVACETRPDDYNGPFEGPWVADCSQSEMLECFANWEPDVQELLNVSDYLDWRHDMDSRHLQCIQHPTRWVIHHLKPLPSYVGDSVVLVGDAVSATMESPYVMVLTKVRCEAHAMTPHQGSGAGQAIEVTCFRKLDTSTIIS